MSSRTLRASLVAALALVVFTAACATRINNVLADPSRYRDRNVTVSGIVNESFSFAGRGAYQIEDESGSLWVVSDRGVPRRGARVEAKGTIREAFNVGRLSERLPINGVIMLEESHKAR
jgi:hypothetical protein